jgi:hypothetical protein
LLLDILSVSQQVKHCKTCGSTSDQNSTKNYAVKQATGFFPFYVRAFIVVLLKGDLQSDPDGYGKIILGIAISYCRGVWNRSLFL